MRYRVDELASRAGMSVDTVRFYQTKGLLPAPERDGRVAWYSGEHLDRLERIRRLKDNGFTLSSIARLFSGDVEAADQVLADVLESPGGDDEGPVAGGSMTLDELAERTGVSATLLQAIERERLLSPREVDGKARYSEDDARAVAAGLQLLEAGLPLGELLALARDHDRAMRAVAEQAVDLFAEFVRAPIRAAASSEEEVAERLADAFHRMLPATAALVAHHFKRVLLEAAQDRIDAASAPDEADEERVETP